MDPVMRVLVTGGAGYIGSHTCVELLDAGHDVVVVDSLVHASPAAIPAIEAASGKAVTFHRIDIRDRQALDAVFASARVDAVFHFAALKAVAESTRDPLRYFDNNVGGTITLAQSAIAAGVNLFVFSSSATVYGIPAAVPVDETAALMAVNPYGRSKLFDEQILTDLQAARSDMRIALLRYFNPGGAHHSGLIGEDPRDEPSNLLPCVARVAAGQTPRLRIFGGDWPTRDGTGVRDYIHVVDVARGHVAALNVLADDGGPTGNGGVLTVNLGTGRGCSVLEIVRAFERASGRPVPFDIVERRPGDVASCFADPSRARQLLGWQTEHDIERVCADAWRWQTTHPDGHDSAASSAAI